MASVNLRLSAWNLQQMGNRHQSHHKHHDDVNDYYDYEDDLDGGGGDYDDMMMRRTETSAPRAPQFCQ